MENLGYLALVLHAHLPFIKHPEYDNFLEENWFFEALTDTYIPLIRIFDQLIDDNIDFKITVSLSPTLISMLMDDLLVSRYIKYLDRLIKLSEKEINRTSYDPKINKLALMYNNRYKTTKFIFKEKYNSNILLAFKKFQEKNKVEVITCCATHGFLPFMDLYKPAIRMQVKVACDLYKEVFNTNTKGIWLPECAYLPEHDNILKEFGIKYFLLESHGILFGKPKPKYKVYSSYACKSGVNVFARDMESSKSVWSSKEGYPGDYNYREYYRDIGYDLDYDYIKPFIDIYGGKRMNLGIKYHKITGETDYKGIYDREEAINTASLHASNFVFNREQQLLYLNKNMDRKPIIVSPYDAELFGHWWFEGPEWIDFLFRKIYSDSEFLETITPSQYLDLYSNSFNFQPAMSTWGDKGYNEVWLNETNDWIYRHLHKITEIMIDIANTYNNVNNLETRLLNQMARELLLAQSSDWAFIMKTNTFVSYAVKRTEEHVKSFLLFYEQFLNKNIDIDILEQREQKFNLFKNISYRDYSSNKY